MYSARVLEIASRHSVLPCGRRANFSILQLTRMQSIKKTPIMAILYKWHIARSQETCLYTEAMLSIFKKIINYCCILHHNFNKRNDHERKI